MTDTLRERYVDIGPLGAGGMGEVRRVRDRVLARDVALKTLRWDLVDDLRARTRFEAEATMTAGLTHPAIVPVHDRGVGADGSPWYTMKLVEGRTLARAIDDGLPLRRAVEAFARVCEAMAYAHARGVIHRDIKPDNIMLGPFGEVLLMDWGLARPVGEPPASLASSSTRSTHSFAAGDAGASTLDAPDDVGLTAPTGGVSIRGAADDGPAGTPGDGLTGTGAVIGTPAFMAPEQLDPSVAAVGPPADVYALGGTLYQLVTGRRPRAGRQAAIDGLLDGSPVRLAEGPEPIRQIADRALALEPAERFPDAGALAEAVRAWLDGEARRARARALLVDAERLMPQSSALRAEAERLRRDADTILGPLPPHAPVEQKAPGWDLEDAAAERLRAARIADVRYLEAVQAALRIAPDLAEARDHLTGYYRRRLLDAEAARDADTAAEYAELLRGHDPTGNAEWLRGDGALTLVTDPPGARVRVFRYVLERRRLVPVFERELPPTPLYDHPLAMGSYALELTLPGHRPVTYPVVVERTTRWDGIRPGERDPHPIWMPPVGDLPDDMAYVPAGWFVSGDPAAPDGLPRQRVWVDAFALGIHPVTNGAYIEWLNGFLDAGREDEALRHAPRARGGSGSDATVAYARHPNGGFEVGIAEGFAWDTAGPVAAVDWRSAKAFTRWASERRGHLVRLPHSLEWEKAARGVDGRRFGWGEHYEPTWAMTAQSRPGRPRPVPVHAFPTDAGPYGTIGHAGNTRDLCLDRYRRAGPPLVDGLHTIVDEPIERGAFCVVKGGSYGSAADQATSAARFGFPPDHVTVAVGFRLCRPLSRPSRSRCESGS